MQPLRLSEILLTLRDLEGERIRFDALMYHLKEGGFALMMLLFSAPTALPLPAVGVATILALPVFFFAVQMLLGRRTAWLPAWLARRTLSKTFLNKVIDTLYPRLLKIEHFLKPRFILFSSRVGERLIGLACVICSLCVMVPLPFSNTVPSMGIVLMCLGIFERDGRVILGGMFVGLGGVALVATAYWLGVEVVKGWVVSLMAWLGLK